MAIVAFEKVVEFTVDVLMPMLPSISGVDAIRGGEWFFSPGNPRTDPMPEPGPARNELSLNWVFTELAKDDSIPKFRSFMNDDDYHQFVGAYFVFMRNADLRLRDAGDNFLSPILKKIQGDDFRSCWVPRPHFRVHNDLRVLDRKKFRESCRKKLKEMCMDGALLAPYYVGSREDYENGHIQSEGVRLFLATECIVVVKSGFSIDYSDNGFFKSECVRWLCRTGNAYRVAKKKVVEAFDSRRLSLVGDIEFEKLLVSDDRSARGVVAELTFGEPNSKGWYVLPWYEKVVEQGEGEGDKIKSQFKTRKCSDIVYRALVELWRANKEIPTRSSLRDHWFELIRNRPSIPSLKIDPNDREGLLLLDVNLNAYLNEKDVKVEDLVKRFVCQV